MAAKQLYVTSPFKYNTRMMQAGEPVEMPGPHQRLYLALGKVSHDKPKVPRAAVPVAEDDAEAPQPRRRRKAKKPA